MRRIAPVMNSRDVRAIFNEANAKKPGTVRLVMNGHLHVDHLRVLDNILYFDVNSANFQYYAKTHSKYPADFMKAHSQSPHTIAWTEPLSAIVTLSADGRIKIEGSEADWLYGVTPVQVGFGAFEWDGTGTCQPEAGIFYRSDNESQTFHWMTGNGASKKDMWNAGTSVNPVKTIYDPCPEGWMVPKAGVWDIFGERGSSSVNKNENTTRYNQKDAGVEFYIDAPKESEHKKYNFAYFPAMGIRHATGGYSNNYKTRGYLHTTQAATSNSRIDRWGFALFESGNAVSIVKVEESISKYATRTHALNVRCVREKDITAGNEEENNNNEEYNQVPW